MKSVIEENVTRDLEVIFKNSDEVVPPSVKSNEFLEGLRQIQMYMDSLEPL